jgi:hypothetical protein
VYPQKVVTTSHMKESMGEEVCENVV